MNPKTPGEAAEKVRNVLYYKAINGDLEAIAMWHQLYGSGDLSGHRYLGDQENASFLRGYERGLQEGAKLSPAEPVDQAAEHPSHRLCPELKPLRDLVESGDPGEYSALKSSAQFALEYIHDLETRDSLHQQQISSLSTLNVSLQKKRDLAIAERNKAEARAATAERELSQRAEAFDRRRLSLRETREQLEAAEAQVHRLTEKLRLANALVAQTAAQRNDAEEQRDKAISVQLEYSEKWDWLRRAQPAIDKLAAAEAQEAASV